MKTSKLFQVLALTLGLALPLRGYSDGPFERVKKKVKKEAKRTATKTEEIAKEVIEDAEEGLKKATDKGKAEADRNERRVEVALGIWGEFTSYKCEAVAGTDDIFYSNVVWHFAEEHNRGFNEGTVSREQRIYRDNQCENQLASSKAFGYYKISPDYGIHRLSMTFDKVIVSVNSNTEIFLKKVLIENSNYCGLTEIQAEAETTLLSDAQLGDFCVIPRISGNYHIWIDALLGQETEISEMKTNGEDLAGGLSIWRRTSR